MPPKLVLCLFLLSVYCFSANKASLANAKAFYCRDPDTGRLYPVNSTWHASSFCGSYTCRLRKKLQDDTYRQYPPPAFKVVDGAVTADAQSNTTTLEEPRKNCTQSGQNTAFNKPNNHINYPEKYKDVIGSKNVEIAAKTDDGDRYLTEEEITALSLLLQTMKKSDLEAILEVYNLAADIYKEIDKVTEAKLISNATNAKGEKTYSLDNAVGNMIFNQLVDKRNKKKPVSYWYEPLAVANGKNKIADMLMTPEEPDNRFVEPQVLKQKEAITPKTLYALPTVDLAKIKHRMQEISAKKIQEKPIYDDRLNNNDIRKLPYYHAISNFAKQASYSRPVGHLQSTPISYIQSPAYRPEVYQPALYPAMFYQPKFPQIVSLHGKEAIPKYAEPLKESYQDPKMQKFSQTSEQQNSVQPESRSQQNGKLCCKNDQILRLLPWSKILKSQHDTEPKSSLPYPEINKINPKNQQSPIDYLQNYSLNTVSNPYSNENSWPVGNINNHDQNPSYVQTAYPLPNEIVINSDMSSEVRDENQEVIQNLKDPKSESSEWHTAPLALSVLNEVKANIAKAKFLPFPFRRKLKMEKVGKLLRIEDVPRRKRHIKEQANNNGRPVFLDDYEVYMEKSTCQTDTEPGFFRMGNESQPFPGCCPQRIYS